MVAAVKEMKLREARHESDTISLDEDKTTTTIEESFTSNIPKKFTLKIPVTPDYIGEFHFDVTVEKPSDRYRNSSPGEPGKKMIILRCTNPSDILQGCMKHVLSFLPPELPRLYGKMEIRKDNQRW